MEIMRELIPVIQEAIRAGKAIGIWYIIALTLIPLIKTVINWTFIFAICKGIYALVLTGVQDAPKK